MVRDAIVAIYDLGGNVWEWCVDFLDDGRQNILRGDHGFAGLSPPQIAISHCPMARLATLASVAFGRMVQLGSIEKGITTS